MKLSAFVAIAAVITSSFLIPIPAEAYTGCQPAYAANVMKQVIRGGGSYEQAVKAAAEEGYAVATETCWYRIKSEFDQLI